MDFILFADGTTILYSSDDICSDVAKRTKLTREINKSSEIINCFRANKLLVNVLKTNCTSMSMGTPKMTFMNNTGGNESKKFHMEYKNNINKYRYEKQA